MTRHRAAAWLFWFGLLALVTSTLRWARGDLDQAYPVVTMLLLIVGGSVAGGRPLGFALAACSSALIDYFFQPPFDLLSVDKPLDGLILTGFLVTAFAVTDLLTRSRQEALDAKARAEEVESLARAGAESLRYAEPEEAVLAIAQLSRESLGVEDCAIVAISEDGSALEVLASTADAVEPLVIDGAKLAVRLGVIVHVSEDGQLREVPETGTSRPIRSRVVLLPLRAEARMVGAIAVLGAEPFILDVARRRLLAAFGFYAALALERARLMAAAAQSARLREMQRARDEIFASVSHDLRTPLTTIKAIAQNELGDGHASAVRIVEQVDRLARMVGDLLDTSRLRTGGIVLHPAINTAEDLIGAAFRRAEGVRNGRQLTATFDLEAPVLAGHFDFVQTLRALGNLIDNALRHSPPGEIVDVRCTRAADSLVFSVADRGPGVPVDERERIFDAFYRPADAVPDTGHAGLGLAIARSLARVQGGDVSFHPREGGGSVFELRLPATDLDVGEGELDAPDEESFAEIFDDS